MAKILDEFPPDRRGRPAKYPYKQWLDGQVHLLIEGQDFEPGEARSVPCPECGEAMHDMGLDFKAPRQDDVKQWTKVEILFNLPDGKVKKVIKVTAQVARCQRNAFNLYGRYGVGLHISQPPKEFSLLTAYFS